ncbi:MULTISPECIES: hypothetical protein [Acinetobacter]|jgi:predicted regulator of amino acid metabolism with ACT domain|uniref:Uncharacterized protein n=1 Tax=Acinetobacter tibetensis TaxID=2943497 RepID=A0AAE9RZP1_9GAMM|nr:MULTISPECIES: hypothetical protein [Acinetobacter]PWB16181.1 hypothetical protein DCO44_04095 [Acinetobacter sp. AM]USE82369.1 hypothetical protein M5E07_11180 [Acinetobacter tibetensis]HEX5381725.1 hypothetical protein [Acinetobacter sp.]
MKQDDFLKQITSKLDGLAQQHKAKPVVMNHVLDHIQQKKSSRFVYFKMTGFALAAAIAGIVVLPNSIDMSEKPQNQVVVTPKLSPQMVEDLEMLMVLGEDKVPHGS